MSKDGLNFKKRFPVTILNWLLSGHTSWNVLWSFFAHSSNVYVLNNLIHLKLHFNIVESPQNKFLLVFML